LSLSSLCKNVGITRCIEVGEPNTLALFMHMHILMPRKDEYKHNNFSLLRSKIRELHPVHKASLRALLRHLFRVASHSDKNGPPVKNLSFVFYEHVLGFYSALEGGINLKARCIALLSYIPAETPKGTRHGGSYTKCAYLVRRVRFPITAYSPIRSGKDDAYLHLWLAFKSRVSTVR
jgi:hypothetical protein